jgi:hypothetical protein
LGKGDNMIISFCGYKQSGKDTCSKYLCENHGFVQRSFAYSLKKGVCEMMGWTKKHMEDSKLKETKDSLFGISPRELFQFIGTDVFQYMIQKKYPDFIGKDIWATRMYLTLVEDIKKSKNFNYTISDMRFWHEAKMLEKFEHIFNIPVFFVRISRKDQINKDRHISEKVIDTMDAIIDHQIINDGTIGDLENKVLQYITSLKE